MTYAGGKAKVAKAIAAMLLSLKQPGHTTYIEPFMGGANIFCHMAPHFGKALGSDVSKDLILMWQALQDGWIPPTPSEATAKLHNEQRFAEPSALRGFVGFGCSFRGIWFGGYGDERCRSNAYNSVQDQIKMMKHARFMCQDYRTLTKVSERCLIYCDPPYYATSGYSAGTRHFDSAEFWPHAREWAKQGALVCVSEYNAPEGVEVIWEGKKVMSLSSSVAARKVVTERLFLVKP